MRKKLYVISDSLKVSTLFAKTLDNFSGVETTWLESFFSAVKLLEQSSATPFAKKPDVIVVDASTIDFREPHTQDEFTRLKTDIVVLAILPEAKSNKAMPDFLDRFRPFDILIPPLSAVEITYRLRAALAYAECRAKEQLFEQAVTEMGAGVLILDADETIRWSNPEAANLLGCDPDELLNRSLSSLTGANETGKALITKGERRSLKIRMVKKDGSYFWANCVAGNFISSEGSVFPLVFTDISEEKEREEALLLSAKVFEFAGEAIMITDAKDRILSVNEAFVAMTGYSIDDVIGRRPDFLNSGRQDHRFYEKMWEDVHQHGHWTGEVWNRLKSGRIRPMWMALTAVENSADEIDHYVTILSDITDRLAEEKHLRHLAQHDFLTGLPNRVLLKDRFSQAAAGANRNGWKIVLLFLDLNKFKEINDSSGHTVGDQLLQQVAERLLACLRSSDTACRWGGDEFVLLFPGITETEDISGIVEKITETIRQPFRINGDVYRISASIGISRYPEHGTNLDGLLAHADTAMYTAKRNDTDMSDIPAI